MPEREDLRELLNLPLIRHMPDETKKRIATLLVRVSELTTASAAAATFPSAPAIITPTVSRR